MLLAVLSLLILCGIPLVLSADAPTSHDDAGPSTSRTSSAESRIGASDEDLPKEPKTIYTLQCKSPHCSGGERGDILRNRVRESTRKGEERTRRDFQRLFPDPEEYAEMWKQFRQYQHVARKYGVDQAKVKLLGHVDVKGFKKKKKRTEMEKTEARQQASERFIIRRRLKDRPDDPVMLARAKEIGMDLNHMIQEREKVDYVLRFLEIHHPELIPYHLALSKDEDATIKKHPIGFRYLVKKRTETEEVDSSGGEEVY